MRGGLGWTGLTAVAAVVAALGLTACDPGMCGASPFINALFCAPSVSPTPIARSAVGESWPAGTLTRSMNVPIFGLSW